MAMAWMSRCEAALQGERARGALHAAAPIPPLNKIMQLSPLIKLQNLEELNCSEIPETTSLLSLARALARCPKLKTVWCNKGAKDLGELMEKRPDLIRYDYNG